MKRILIFLTVAFAGCTVMQAQTAYSLFWKKDGVQVPEIVSGKGDLYQEVGHHGPAVENSHFALRIYFNDSGAVDVYSKTGRGMELDRYKWYPTTEQQENEGAGCDEYMVCFAVIHLMAFLITFMVVIQFFGKHALSWLRLKFSSPSESYIFFELNEASFALAKDLKAKRGKPFIVFLDKRLKSRADTEAKTKTLRSVFRRREPLFEQASKMDALLLNREYTESTTLSDVGIARLLRKGKSRLFFFSDNVEYNIQSAVKIIKEIGRMKSAAEKVEVYVKAEADYMIGAFEQGRPKNVNVHIVNSAKLAVTELALAHPPVDYVDIDERQATARQGFTMMIIGFGGVGGYALRYLTELGQFVGTESRAIVVDREMDGKRGEFEARFPGMSHYRVDYHGMTVGGTAYWNDRYRSSVA